jgi:hypothetical protein
VARFEPGRWRQAALSCGRKLSGADERVMPALAARYEVMVAVMSGAVMVSEGAKRLGLSRNRFQSLLHRGEAHDGGQMSA